MSILAVLDVEDDGSLKIRNFRDAWTDLGNETVKQQQRMAASGQQATAAAKQQADAITQLTQQARENYAQMQKNAQAFSLLQGQLRAGSTVTDVQAKALAELSKQTAGNATFTQKYGAELTALTGKIRAGTVVTAEQAKSLQTVTQGYLGAGQGAQQASQATESFNLRAAALAATLSLLFAGLYNFLRGTGDLAARVETLGVVMGIVGKNAFLSSQEMRVQVEAIKRLGITTTESTNAVIQFVQANLKLADASKIARTAQDLAVISGQNSSDAFRTLTSAIQIQQPMLLRQFGIVTGLDEIYSKHAKTIGKTVKELDGFDKKQAFVNKILEEGKEAAGAYEASMSTAGKQIGSFARYVDEARLALGSAFLPAMLLAVQTATTLMKAWLDLPPALQQIAAALLAGAAAMTMFAAALAGAQFLGILGTIRTLATEFALLTKLIWMGIPALESLLLVFSAWQLALGGITLALGLAVAAYIYFSKQVEITIDQQARLAAAAEAEIRTINDTAKAFSVAQEKVEELTAKKNALEAVNNRSHEQSVRLEVITNQLDATQVKYNSSLKKLLDLTPDAIVGIDGMATGYGLLTTEIAGATDALEAQKKAYYDVSVAQLADLERRAAEEHGKIAPLLKQQAQLQADIAKARAGGTVTRTTMFGRDGTVQQTAVDLKALETEMARVQASISAQGGSWQELTSQVSRFGPVVEAQRLKLKEFADDAKRAGDASVTEVWNKWSGSMKDHAERMKVSGLTMQEAMKKAAGDPKAMEDILNDVDSKWAEHTKKVEANAKKQLTAYESARAKILGLTPQEMGTYKAYNEALNEAGLSTDEYNRRLREAGPILASFRKETGAVQEQFKGLAEHAAKLDKVNLEATFKKWNDASAATAAAFHKQMGEMQKSFEDFAGNTQRGFDESTFTRLREYGKKLHDSDIAQAEDARQKREAIYEQLVVSKMREVDKALYAERKRIDGIVRAAEEEKKARNEALAEERRIVQERLETDLRLVESRLQADLRMMASRTAALRHDLAMDLIRQKSAIETDTALDRKQKDIEKAAATAAQTRLTEELRLLEEFHAAELRSRAKANSTRLRDSAAAARAILDIDGARVAEQNRLTDQLTNEQIAASGKMRDQIVDNYRVMKDFAINAAQEIASGFVSGFLQAITGAKSFKDELIGVMESLKRSVFKILDGIIQKALNAVFEMLRVRAAGGDVNAAGALQQMAFSNAAGNLSSRPIGGVDSRAGGGGIPVGMVGRMGWQGARTGFASSVGGAALGGAGFGWMAGSMVGRYADGSYARGALGGAAAGAATGAAYGGWVGAAAGAIAGGISGWWQARKQRKQMEEDRKAIIEDMGGMAAFKKAAEEAGFAYEKFLNTKKPSEFGKEVLRLKAALEELDLKKAKTQLEDFYGGLDRLRERATAAGLSRDFTNVYGPSAEELAARADRMGLDEYGQPRTAPTTGGAPPSAEDARKALDVLAAKLSFIESHGGLDKLREKAEKAGVSIENMLNAQTIEDATREMEKLARALEMDRLRTSFIAIHGGLERLRELALAAGVSLDALLNADTLEDVQRAIEELSNALEIQRIKQSFLDAYGSLERLAEAARRAGIDINDLLSADTLEEAQAAAEALAKALELRKAKDELYEVTSQLREMQRIAKATGFDLDRLFNATTVEGFNQAKEEFERLAKVFAAQEAAMRSAVSAFNSRMESFSTTVDRAAGRALDSLSKEQLEELEKQYKAAQEEGYKGSQFTFARDNADALDLTKEQLQALKSVAGEVAGEFALLQRQAAALFMAYVAQTGDFLGAIEAMGPALDQIKANAEALGLPLDGLTERLIGFRNTIQQNIDVAGALGSINQLIDGLEDAKALTQEWFDLLSQDAWTQFQKLEERGVALDESLMMMQPTLQRLWEAQRNYGFEVDANTQRLLDLAQTNGMIGEQFMSTEGKMLDVLVMIARVLGVDVPEAYGTSTRAAEESADKQIRLLEKVKRYTMADFGITEKVKMGARAESELVRRQREVEEWEFLYDTKVVQPQKAFGEWISTTGVQQWQIHFSEATTAAQTADREGLATLRAGIDQIGVNLDTNLLRWQIWRDGVVALVRDVGAVMRETGEPPERSGGDTTPAGRPAPADTHVTNVYVQTTVAPTLSVNALDGSDVERVGGEILDGFMANVRDNRSQVARDFEVATRPYRGRR